MKFPKKMLAMLLSALIVMAFIPVTTLTAAATDFQPTNEDELRTALTSTTTPDNITLAADITITSRINIPSGKVKNLDLNGHILTVDSAVGTNPAINCSGTLNLFNTPVDADSDGVDDGGVNHLSAGLLVNNGTFNLGKALTSSTFNGDLQIGPTTNCVAQASVTINGNATLNSLSVKEGVADNYTVFTVNGSVICKSGDCNVLKYSSFEVDSLEVQNGKFKTESAGSATPTIVRVDGDLYAKGELTFTTGIGSITGFVNGNVSSGQRLILSDLPVSGNAVSAGALSLAASNLSGYAKAVGDIYVYTGATTVGGYLETTGGLVQIEKATTVGEYIKAAKHFYVKSGGTSTFNCPIEAGDYIKFDSTSTVNSSLTAGSYFYTSQALTFGENASINVGTYFFATSSTFPMDINAPEYVEITGGTLSGNVTGGKVIQRGGTISGDVTTREFQMKGGTLHADATVDCDVFRANGGTTRAVVTADEYVIASGTFEGSLTVNDGGSYLSTGGTIKTNPVVLGANASASLYGGQYQRTTEPFTFGEGAHLTVYGGQTKVDYSADSSVTIAADIYELKSGYYTASCEIFENTTTGTKYTALATAYNEATAGDTIKLTGDYYFTPAAVLTVTKDITIDLNGYAISDSGPYSDNMMFSTTTGNTAFNLATPDVKLTVRNGKLLYSGKYLNATSAATNIEINFEDLAARADKGITTAGANTDLNINNFKSVCGNINGQFVRMAGQYSNLVINHTNVKWNGQGHIVETVNTDCTITVNNCDFEHLRGYISYIINSNDYANCKAVIGNSRLISNGPGGNSGGAIRVGGENVDLTVENCYFEVSASCNNAIIANNATNGKITIDGNYLLLGSKSTNTSNEWTSALIFSGDNVDVDFTNSEIFCDRSISNKDNIGDMIQINASNSTVDIKNINMDNLTGGKNAIVFGKDKTGNTVNIEDCDLRSGGTAIINSASAVTTVIENTLNIKNSLIYSRVGYVFNLTGAGSTLNLDDVDLQVAAGNQHFIRTYGTVTINMNSGSISCVLAGNSWSSAIKFDNATNNSVFNLYGGSIKRFSKIIELSGGTVPARLKLYNGMLEKVGTGNYANQAVAIEVDENSKIYNSTGEEYTPATWSTNTSVNTIYARSETSGVVDPAVTLTDGENNVGVIKAENGKVTLPKSSSYWYNADDGKVYAGGDEVNVANDATLSSKNVGIKQLKGAGVRYSSADLTGLRYQATFNAEEYDALEAFAAENNGSITKGMIIAPLDYISGDFTMAALDANGKMYGKLNSTLWFGGNVADSNGNYTVAGSIVNIKSSNYARKFAARAYIELTLNEGTADKSTAVYYGYFNEGENARSAAEVAFAAYTDRSDTLTEGYQNQVGDSYSPYTLDKLNIMKGYIDGVSKVIISPSEYVVNLFNCEYYTSPYTVSYDGASVAVSAADITAFKGLIIGGKAYNATKFTIAGNTATMAYTPA